MMSIYRVLKISLMISIIIVLGFLPPILLVWLPVPIVFQNLGITLTGLLLGKKDGMICVCLFLLLAMIGFPFLSGGHGGIAAFYGVTGGYLLAYPIAAYLIGWWRELIGFVFLRLLFGIVLVNVLIVNGLGALGMSLKLDTAFFPIFVSTVVFFPGDLLKGIIAIMIAFRLKKFI